ncbi:hypothetical protein BDK88_3287 [Natrinema hispanicum]|uniref:Uncharacterized protein n=1 Tax=Natrinema hispanicum TaxID=392421 RepID=A0A482Y3J6_9EURY|nr:hypothetical protein [Natrinema hispanicum]RZV08319.1 hypothetical protein BDK88_3287 [Natrinema hispanicum]
MDQSGFVKLSLIGFALVIVSFVIRGLSRIVLEVAVADLIQAPLAIVGFGLLVYLFVRATLDFVGLWPIERGET